MSNFEISLPKHLKTIKAPYLIWKCNGFFTS